MKGSAPLRVSSCSPHRKQQTVHSAADCTAPCRQLHLVVESDFSGGARCVWLDPVLVCAPILDKGIVAELEQAARVAEVGNPAVSPIILHQSIGAAFQHVPPLRQAQSGVLSHP